MSYNRYCVKCNKHISSELRDPGYDLCEKCLSKLQPKIQKGIKAAFDASPNVLEKLSGGKYYHNPGMPDRERNIHTYLDTELTIKKLCGKTKNRRNICDWCGDEYGDGRGRSSFCSDSCDRRYFKDVDKKQAKADKKARKLL